MAAASGLVPSPVVVPVVAAHAPAAAELSSGQPGLERDRSLDVQPQEPPLSIGAELLVGVKLLAVGHVQDLGDIGKDVRVAVWAFGVDPRCAELGLIPGDVRRPAAVASPKAASWLPGWPASAYTAGTGQPRCWTRLITVPR